MGCTTCNGNTNFIDDYNKSQYNDVEVEGFAKSRLTICNSCPQVTNLAILNFTLYKSCKKSAISLTNKIKDINEKCPLSKW